MIVKSDEARTRFRELLDHAERGGDVRILRYNRPVATMTIADPNPLDDRLLAMARIVREGGDDQTATEIEGGAAYIRETLRGSDDSNIGEALGLISDYASDLAEIVRAWPSAARKADMESTDEGSGT